MLPGLVLANEAADPRPGQSVRVTTGLEVTGEGFVMKAGEIHGRSLSHDKRTMTFDVNGHAIRVPKPSTTVEGEIQASEPERLVLTPTGQSLPIVVPRAAISSLEMRRRESWKPRGLLFGALVGGAIGYAIGSGHSCLVGESGLAALCTSDRLQGALFGVVGGAILGVLVAPGAKWEHVPLGHAQVRLVGPNFRRGIGLSLSVGF
jgi:hypothetical protein